VTAEFETLRRTLLDAALPHVPFDGWSRGALLAGARDAGLEPAAVLRAFPRGPIEAIELFSRDADARMLEALERLDLDAMRVRERIATAVRLRLEANAAHREAIRSALSALALPPNAATGARLLYRTVDAIWYAAGDTATDFNFYSKRGLLAAVYGATLLAWLDDQSERFADTWAFLDRRISEVMQVPRLQARVGRLFDTLTDPLRRAAGGSR
jgi:ubiquinone biosynthesis protein COQ9